MRRSEITSELIDLSKLAKELGFPQDVEEGDFVCYINAYGNREISVVTKAISSKAFWLGDGSYILEEDNWFLILSFSRCLAFLRERGWHIAELGECKSGDMDILITNDPYAWDSFTVFDHDSPHIGEEGKTHHKAIAKAVVKILEGGSG